MDPFASPLPLFPLQTVLFPGGVLPLKIFEVRYLDLIGRGHGLWVATETEPIADDTPAHVPDEQMHLVRMLEQVARSMKSAEGRGMDELWRQPHLWDDAGWVANRWCELLPVKAELRQRCMALTHPVLRLELVDDMLERLGVRTGSPGPAQG